MTQKSKPAAFEAGARLGMEECTDLFVLHRPHEGVPANPVIYDSPHSGRCYPAEFVRETALPLSGLRASEDFAVDLLFMAAPSAGSHLLAAQRPRAWLDLNRAPDELSAEMFDGAAPEWARTDGERARAGLGVIPRIISEDREIYARRLSWREARQRIDAAWKPYHARLRALLEETRARFGAAILIDCHSMPESAAKAMTPLSLRQPDIILGDVNGASCDPLLTDTLHRLFADAGLNVRRNRVYTGGYITRRYGLEGFGAHAIQIEINRRLYTRPGDYRLTEAFFDLQKIITGVIHALPKLLTPLWRKRPPLAAE